VRELDGGDFGQDVNSHRSNSNLINHLFFCERFRADPIMLEGSAKFLEGRYDAIGVLR
jgi:hypothetical protein